MNQATKDELSKEEVNKFHRKLLDFCKTRVDNSRSAMSKYYNSWDKRDETYRAIRKVDRTDIEAAKNGEPVKMTVPISTSQINTFISFLFMVFHQRPRLFEFEGTGPEDHDLREAAEVVLDSELKHNRFALQEFQYALDIARYGIGVFKHGWTKEVVRLMVGVEATEEIFGQEVTTSQTETYQDFVKYEGNKVVAISPYRFFPDTRLPLTRHHEGEFCASEDEYHITALRAMEASGEVAGVGHIKNFDPESVTRRMEYDSRFNSLDLNKQHEDSIGLVCITEVQIKIIPADFEVDGKFPLGKETSPIMYLVWYANDSRVIKAEPMTNFHGSFGFETSQFTPDQHHQLNQSLSELINNLQGTIDWFVNSRVASVKRTLDNQLVVDPSVVEMSSLENRSRVILLKRGVARAGLDRYIRPLPVVDVTSGHMNDVGQLTSITHSVTGISDNALGQYHSGRRSATEARAVTQGSTGRLMCLLKLIWDSAYVPLAQKMTSNSRQYISKERLVKILGPAVAEKVQFNAGPDELVGNCDFFVFEGTLPSEKQFLAQSMQELLGLILSNPQAAMQFSLDPNKLIEEIYTLRGVSNVAERFKPDQAALQQQQVQQLLQQAMMAQQPQQPNVQ